MMTPETEDRIALEQLIETAVSFVRSVLEEMLTSNVEFQIDSEFTDETLVPFYSGNIRLTFRFMDNWVSRFFYIMDLRCVEDEKLMIRMNVRHMLSELALNFFLKEYDL
jgi:hypothetical protein